MATQRDSSGSPLFLDITYTIIPSDKISTQDEDNIKDILQQGDAEFIPLRSDGRIDESRKLSHIISETVDFPDYYAALDANVQVVKPSWVVTSMYKKRQSQTRQHSPDPAMFFSQVVLSCGDLPEGDKDAIIAGVLAMGGLYSSPLTKLVTHIATLRTDNDKCGLAMQKMPECNIVLPHWFDDCFRLGKLIGEAPYKFPNPEILQPSHNPVIALHVPDIEGATSAVGGKPPKYRPPQSPSQSRKTLSVFQGKKILFSRDLNVNEHLAKTLQSLVEQAGGEMTTTVQDCDLYIGHYREGSDYVDASQAGKTVANLSWFYNVINRNRWTNPLSKLLHYPVPREGISGFKGMRISLSNYTGDARIYLENLVKETGAEFTKTMKQDNTHLITAHTHSEKCDAAQEWNIHIINHLWLEESYAKCEVQSLTQSRYTHFPPRTNLSEVVGQTPINLERVKRFYFATTEKVAKNGERAALESGTTLQPYRGAVPPQPSPKKAVPVPASSAIPATALEDTSSNAPVETTKTLREEEEEEGDPPAPQTATKSRSRGVSDAATPARKVTEEKENDTPSTTGRASKNRALDAMHKQREDIALFQREMKRKGGVIRGGRKMTEDEAPASAKKTGRGRKRASVEAPDEDGDVGTGNGTDEEAAKPAARQSKKARKSDNDGDDAAPAESYRLLVTGDARWGQDAKKDDINARKLRKLGIEVVTEPADCNILCARNIIRTPKFVSALAMAPTVVSTDWLDHLLKASTTLKNRRNPEDHLLVDRGAEEKWGFSLSESLDRAKQNQGHLLRNWTIYVTDKVPKGFDLWRGIIAINGGTPTIYRGRTGLNLAKPRVPPSADPDAGLEKLNQGPNADEEVDIAYLVSGTEEEEVKLWKTFRAQTKKQGLRARIVQTEWILHLAMAQRIEWDPAWECKEDTVPGFKEKYGR